MKTFTALLCFAACVAAVLASGQDEDLDKQWAQHKEAIVNRLKEYQSRVEEQLKEQLEGLKSLSGAVKEFAQNQINETKAELERIKYQINKLEHYGE